MHDCIAHILDVNSLGLQKETLISKKNYFLMRKKFFNVMVVKHSFEMEFSQDWMDGIFNENKEKWTTQAILHTINTIPGFPCLDPLTIDMCLPVKWARNHSVLLGTDNLCPKWPRGDRCWYTQASNTLHAKIDSLSDAFLRMKPHFGSP